MARGKLRSGVNGWPGTLSIVEYMDASEEGKVGSVLVDGQHRLGAYTLLARKVTDGDALSWWSVGVCLMCLLVQITIEAECFRNLRPKCTHIYNNAHHVVHLGRDTIKMSMGTLI